MRWMVGGVLLGAATLVSAADDLAFPGYSGYLNVPSATVLNHAQADLQYSDQGWINSDYEHRRNFSGAVGIFPFVEVGGRLTWDETHTPFANEVRDLSANMKVQMPLLPEEWFTLAAGVQDLGGAANNFGANYVVAGRAFGPLELALGYGQTDEPGRYLDGAFGAVSWRAFEWLNLMAEYDAVDARVGAGLASPRGWLPAGMQLKGKVMATDSGDNESGRHYFSVGLSLPLGHRNQRHDVQFLDVGDGRLQGKLLQTSECPPNCRSLPASDPAGTAGITEQGGAPEQGNRVQGTLPQSLAGQAPTQEQLPVEVGSSKSLGDVLVRAGYERVAVSEDNGQPVIRFENNVYNRDEREALWDAAQRLHAAQSGHASVQLVLLNQGIVVARRHVRLEGDAPRLASVPDTALPNTWQPVEGNGPWWKPRVMLSPNITSAIGTEYGVWDASYALGTEVSASLWKGALAAATWNTAVYDNDDFEEGQVFYNERQRSDLLNAEVQQTFRLHKQLFTSMYAGRYQYDYDGVLNETLLFSPSRRHAIGYIGGAFQHVDIDGLDPQQMLGRYSYYHPGHDVQLHVYGGEFFEGDHGVRAEGRFWFGDYAVTLTYKNTDAEFIGLGVVLPLTPVKDRQWRYLQVRGNPDWTYTVQTRINEDRNVLSFGSALMVRSPNTLERTYLNRLRLAP